jgi:hypothetical protein
MRLLLDYEYEILATSSPPRISEVFKAAWGTPHRYLMDRIIAMARTRDSSTFTKPAEGQLERTST